jgi:hypothetical protein
LDIPFHAFLENMLHICDTIKAPCPPPKYASSHCFFISFIVFDQHQVVKPSGCKQTPPVCAKTGWRPRIGAARRDRDLFIGTDAVGLKKTDAAISKKHEWPPNLHPIKPWLRAIGPVSPKNRTRDPGLPDRDGQGIRRLRIL